MLAGEVSDVRSTHSARTSAGSADGFRRAPASGVPDSITVKTTRAGSRTEERMRAFERGINRMRLTICGRCCQSGPARFDFRVNGHLQGEARGEGSDRGTTESGVEEEECMSRVVRM